jgi:flagellar biosynthesis protein FlhG
MTSTIAIASGKGGVGKTTISVNLALTLALQEKKILLLDADLGMANTHFLLGINPQKSLEDVVSGKDKLKDIIIEYNQNLSFISGEGANLLNLPKLDRLNLIKEFDSISNDYEYLFVDIGAGGEENTMSFMAACEKVIIVLTEDDTSFHDAYKLIKFSSQERNIDKFGIIVNLCTSTKRAENYFKMLQQVTTKFLDVKLNFLGHVPLSQKIKNSINARVPFMSNRVESQGTRSFKKLASNLVKLENNKPEGIKFFSD